MQNFEISQDASTSVRGCEQGMRDRGEREQGMRDRGECEQGMRDRGECEQGMRD